MAQSGQLFAGAGVDALYDQNALLEMYPESAKEMTDWGVPDEYAYHLAEKLLKEAKQPLFISILTVTNHPLMWCRPIMCRSRWP